MLEAEARCAGGDCHAVEMLKWCPRLCAVVVLTPATAGAQVLMERNVSMALGHRRRAMEECSKSATRSSSSWSTAPARWWPCCAPMAPIRTISSWRGARPHTARTFRQTTEEFFQGSEKPPSNGLRTPPEGAGRRRRRSERSAAKPSAALASAGPRRESLQPPRPPPAPPSSQNNPQENPPPPSTRTARRSRRSASAPRR